MRSFACMQSNENVSLVPHLECNFSYLPKRYSDVGMHFLSSPLNSTEALICQYLCVTGFGANSFSHKYCRLSKKRAKNHIQSHRMSTINSMRTIAFNSREATNSDFDLNVLCVYCLINGTSTMESSIQKGIKQTSFQVDQERYDNFFHFQVVPILLNDKFETPNWWKSQNAIDNFCLCVCAQVCVCFFREKYV